MSSAVTSDMQVQREDLNPVTVRLTIQCSAEQVNDGFGRSVKKLSKHVKIPGFRPGMAPKKMVEEALNPQALYENAAEEIVKRAYDAAIKQEGLEPNGLPSIDLTKLDKDSSTCEFSAKIPLKPIVELAEYKGLEANKPAISVTDEEVEAQVQELQRRQGEKKEVTDRGVQEGDVAVVTLKADGEDGDGRTFMIVAGQTFEGLDKALIGMEPEASKSAKLDFPENFQNKDWAGTKQSVKITVRSISSVQMPELDEAFAKGFNAENIEDLKEKIRDGIRSAKEQSVAEMVRDALLDALISKSTVEVAENTWEQVVDSRMRELAHQAEQNRTTVEAIVQNNGVTMEQFLEDLRADAKVNVKRAVVIDKIFHENEMQVTNEDVGLHLTNIAMENRVPRERFEEFVKQYGAQLREEVIFRTMASKVTDLLVEHAKITEVSGDGTGDGGAEAKPKKAKATKKAKKE